MKNICFFLWCVASIIFAQPIQSIEIRGQKNVSEQLIRHLLLSKPQHTFDPETWNHDLKRLYSFGFFHQLHFSHLLEDTAIKLQIQVEEHPLLIDIEIQGSQHLSSTVLLSHLLLRKGTFLAPYEEVQALQTLRRLYQEQGFFFVRVRAEQTLQETGVRLQFFVEEGPQLKIEKVHLEGLQLFSAETLLPYLLTPPRGTLWKTEILSELKLETDRLAIVHFYRAQGFLDVQVDSAQFIPPLSPPPQDGEVSITPVFTVREGPRYEIHQITFHGNTYVPETALREKITLATGQFLTQKELTQSLRNIYSLYKESPYKHFQVTHEIVFPEKATDTRLDLSFYLIEE